MLLTLLFLSVAFLAFTNGANANFKGVASLYGSGTTSLTTALWWGTICTFAGSITAFIWAEGLIRKFSGKGLVNDELLQSPDLITSVALGAALTSFLATRLGFPVSTTHALVGALLGAGLAATGGRVHFAALGTHFLYPLFFSPLLAIIFGATIYGILVKCRFDWKGRSRLLDLAHGASAGAASFSRGLNDTPKMAALLLVTPTYSMHISLLLIGIMIALGAWLDAKNVAETLAKKVTNMSPVEGFAANFVTAILVSTASIHQMPVSTTHVSVGALVGIGICSNQIHRRKVIEIFVAWITTVPCGAILAAMIYFALRITT